MRLIYVDAKAADGGARELMPGHKLSAVCVRGCVLANV